jgi:hypothetical protein
LLVTLPSNTEDVDENLNDPSRNLDTDEKIQSYLYSFFRNMRHTDRLYLFDSIQEVSQKITKMEGTVSSSTVSRESNMSRDIRSHGNNCCQICGRGFPDGEGLFACHLFELKAVPECVDNLLKSFNDLGLTTVNDGRNYLCLCQKCHDFLDDYNIAINPQNHDLIISNRIFNETIDGVEGISRYRDLVEYENGQPTGRKLTHLGGDAYKHPLKLLEYRKKLYDLEQKLQIMSKNRALDIAVGGKRKFLFKDEEAVKELKTRNLVFKDETKGEMKALLKKFNASTGGNKPVLFDRVQKLQQALQDDCFKETDFEGLEQLYDKQFDGALTECIFQLGLLDFL